MRDAKTKNKKRASRAGCPRSRAVAAVDAIRYLLCFLLDELLLMPEPPVLPLELPPEVAPCESDLDFFFDEPLDLVEPESLLPLVAPLEPP
jgi:hypothetical protein